MHRKPKLRTYKVLKISTVHTITDVDAESEDEAISLAMRGVGDLTDRYEIKKEYTVLKEME